MTNPATFKFSLSTYKARFTEAIQDIDHSILACWAIDCAERMMPYFEDRFDDARPREALQTLEDWLETRLFKMSVIRGASLAAHAAAREVGADNPARSTARATGQAVATAHVPSHAIGAAIYALQAVSRASDPCEAEANVEAEYNWQLAHLTELADNANQ